MLSSDRGHRASVKSSQDIKLVVVTGPCCCCRCSCCCCCCLTVRYRRQWRAVHA